MIITKNKRRRKKVLTKNMELFTYDTLNLPLQVRKLSDP